MIKSMTGFGKGEAIQANRKFIVEMKSVNHRYLDVSIKMPKKLNFFEASIRGELKKYLSRGKVDLYISLEDYNENPQMLHYNGKLAEEYLRYIRQLSEELGVENDCKASRLASFPDVFTMEEESPDEEALWAGLSEALDKAATQMVEARTAEGEQLKEDLLKKLDGMLKLVEQIEARMPETTGRYQVRLEEKIRELLGNTSFDESRILTEVALYADKICVDEETVRLRSHILSTQKELKEGTNVGRKLDFIAQEMNREANTILSKADDLEISGCAIELKTEIEKVREQIQNIE